ncbi:MAG TPA: hypothetical protein VHC97_07070 [Thermoanaerobaculia bacterium]|jgi:hypothetical protein|nr:hypothetical protein [Thermoanaerobaculia bacterium]
MTHFSPAHLRPGDRQHLGGRHTQNIETIQSDNGLVCIAPVPVCLVRKNWREN